MPRAAPCSLGRGETTAQRNAARRTLEVGAERHRSAAANLLTREGPRFACTAAFSGPARGILRRSRACSNGACVLLTRRALSPYRHARPATMVSLLWSTGSARRRAGSRGRLGTMTGVGKWQCRSTLNQWRAIRYKYGMIGRRCYRRITRWGRGGWIAVAAVSVALSPLLAGCSSFSSSSASSSPPEPGAASSATSGSPAAPSSSSASGASAESLRQSLVGFLKAFRDPEPDEVGAPAKMGAAQPQPGAAVPPSSVASAPPAAGTSTSLNPPPAQQATGQ